MSQGIIKVRVNNNKIVLCPNLLGCEFRQKIHQHMVSPGAVFDGWRIYLYESNETPLPDRCHYTHSKMMEHASITITDANISSYSKLVGAGSTTSRIYWGNTYPNDTFNDCSVVIPIEDVWAKILYHNSNPGGYLDIYKPYFEFAPTPGHDATIYIPAKMLFEASFNITSSWTLNSVVLMYHIVGEQEWKFHAGAWGLVSPQVLVDGDVVNIDWEVYLG